MCILEWLDITLLNWRNRKHITRRVMTFGPNDYYPYLNLEKPSDQSVLYSQASQDYTVLAGRLHSPRRVRNVDIPLIRKPKREGWYWRVYDFIRFKRTGGECRNSAEDFS